jgi:CRISPR/Cas system-associated endonuclease Cas3-HD
VFKHISEKYNLILECLNTEKGIKAPGGARFKHWEKAILRKTIIGEKEVLICLNSNTLKLNGENFMNTPLARNCD